MLPTSESYLPVVELYFAPSTLNVAHGVDTVIVAGHCVIALNPVFDQVCQFDPDNDEFDVVAVGQRSVNHAISATVSL